MFVIEVTEPGVSAIFEIYAKHTRKDTHIESCQHNVAIYS